MYLPNRQRLFHGNFNHSWCKDLKRCRDHALYESTLGHMLGISGFPYATQVEQRQTPMKRTPHYNGKPNWRAMMLTADLLSCIYLLIMWPLANDARPSCSPSSSTKPSGSWSPCLHHRLLVKNSRCLVWSTQYGLHTGIFSLPLSLSFSESGVSPYSSEGTKIVILLPQSLQCQHDQLPFRVAFFF